MVGTGAEFRRAISDALAEKPEWLRTATAAITEGMARALQASNERSAKLDLAFRCALGLMDAKRLDDKTRKMLVDPILAALPENGGSEIEARIKEKLS